MSPSPTAAANKIAERQGSAVSMASGRILVSQHSQSLSARNRSKALNETAEERQRRIYSNYEFLLEKENAKSSHAAQQQSIVQSVCTMIKRNKALIHLDLSQTNLTEYMLWHIGKALSRARSVISVHLSGNQGITPTLLKQLHTRIRCRPQLSYRKIGLNVGLNLKGSPMLMTSQGRFKTHDELVVQEKMKMRHLSK